MHATDKVKHLLAGWRRPGACRDLWEHIERQLDLVLGIRWITHAVNDDEAFAKGSTQLKHAATIKADARAILGCEGHNEGSTSLHREVAGR